MNSTTNPVRFAIAGNSGAEQTGKARSSGASDQIRGIKRWFGVLRKPARTALLLSACVLIGYWFNAFDDAVSGVGQLPRAMWALVYIGGWGGAVAGLTLIASALFQVRKRWILSRRVVCHRGVLPRHEYLLSYPSAQHRGMHLRERNLPATRRQAIRDEVVHVLGGYRRRRCSGVVPQGQTG